MERGISSHEKNYIEVGKNLPLTGRHLGRMALPNADLVFEGCNVCSERCKSRTFQIVRRKQTSPFPNPLPNMNLIQMHYHRFSLRLYISRERGCV